MTYWAIVFERPESLDYKGPKKMRIAKVKFDRICDPEVNMIQIGEDVFRLDDKKIFSIERHCGEAMGETTHCFVVCDGHKLKQQG